MDRKISPSVSAKTSKSSFLNSEQRSTTLWSAQEHPDRSWLEGLRLTIKTHMLLLEAGGSDETELITNANRWPMTLGSELDLGLHDGAQPKVEWKVPSLLNGQGPGRRIEHQCLDLVAWTPGRLGLLG